MSPSTKRSDWKPSLGLHGLGCTIQWICNAPHSIFPLWVVDLLLLTAVGWWQASLGTWRGRETWEN